MASSKFLPDESGLLMVFSEPGKDVTLEEFHDWYDNEHVPLRIKKFPEFRSAARYQVTASQASCASDPSCSSSPWTKSGWAALYTISSNDIYNQAAYSNLRTNRSPREAELLSRISILDRRIYRLDSDTASPASASLTPQPASHIEQKARYVVATSVTLSPGENQQAYDEWYEKEHIPMLQKVPGWQRTRRFTLLDALINGKDAAKHNADAKNVPVTLGLHEYDREDFESTPEFKAAISTEWRRKVMGPNDCNIHKRERRVMKLYRAWDPEVALQEEQQGK